MSGLSAGKPTEGQLQDLDLLCIDGTGAAEEPTVVRHGGGHEALGVTEVCRPSRRFEEGVARGGVTRLALGGTEPDGQVDAQDGIGVGGLGVEVEGLGVVAKSVAWGQGSEGGIARLARVTDGFGQVDGLGGTEPVTGQFADSCTRVGPRKGPPGPRPPAGAPGPAGWDRGPHTGCAG